MLLYAIPVTFFTNSLMAVMAGLGDGFVERKQCEEAVFGAEDVCESFLLVSCLALQHALLAVGADHLHFLICKDTDIKFFLCRNELTGYQDTQCFKIRYYKIEKAMRTLNL